MVDFRLFEEPEVNIKEILRYAGVKGDGAEEFSEDIRKCLDELSGKLTYKVCFTELCFNDELISGWIRESKNLSKNLDGCKSIILFAATVGLELDRIISKYSKLSPSKAVLFQAIGAERIEALCNSFNGYIVKEFEKKNLFPRPRFSPGYGDFSLTAQKDIFKRLDCNRKIGLFLNDSMLMSPSKSVTAVIGFSEDVCKVSGGCESCKKTDCEFRR